ncbi:MAG: aminotransferase class V-fold PLP-dependent enzyme [Myxococcales bacterium]|nr:aminotransferase class V-fold PLP-dependent enzyme [Myxococcales bacterium]
MAMRRRSFLAGLTGLGLGAPPLIACVERAVRRVEHVSDEALAADEAFWAEIRGSYELEPAYINLENGYFCMQPQALLEAHLEHVRRINREASHYMRTRQWDDRAAVTAELAQLASCPVDELVITRNTTESLDLVIAGLAWRPGDEAVMAEQDYGSMLDMFELQARRHGVVNRRVSLPNHPRSDDEIVSLYAAAISDKTRLLMVCHMVNITGQILPVRKICDMAHARGVEVMVDGAHAFAHIDSDIPALGCDYYGASLHKWLSAPLGCGLLWVRRDKIAGLWPLLAEAAREPDDIGRLNHTGTHPVHVVLGLRDAIAYHRALGPTRKQARLRYLQRHWTAQVRETPGIVVNTPAEPERACAIANVGVEGIEPGLLAQRLMDEHGIWTVAIDRPPVRGCRITPNLYTTPAELDALVAALRELAGTT